MGAGLNHSLGAGHCQPGAELGLELRPPDPSSNLFPHSKVLVMGSQRPPGLAPLSREGGRCPVPESGRQAARGAGIAMAPKELGKEAGCDSQPGVGVRATGYIAANMPWPVFLSPPTPAGVPGVPASGGSVCGL